MPTSGMLTMLRPLQQCASYRRQVACIMDHTQDWASSSGLKAVAMTPKFPDLALDRLEDLADRLSERKNRFASLLLMLSPDCRTHEGTSTEDLFGWSADFLMPAAISARVLI